MNEKTKEQNKTDIMPIIPKISKTPLGHLIIDNVVYDPEEQDILSVDSVPPEGDLIKERPLTDDKDGPTIRVYKIIFLLCALKKGRLRS